MKNDVWEVVPGPKGKSVVTWKWIYKIKHGADGSVEKHKARFVARGFSQKEDLIWTQASTMCLVCSDRRIFGESGIHQE